MVYLVASRYLCTLHFLEKKRRMKIEVSDKILAVCPSFRFAAIVCDVKNAAFNQELWREIEIYCNELIATCPMEEIKNRKAIFATRQAYKLLGKDPNRYRPSSEAMCRRVVRGLGLYQIDTLVDLINLVSLKTGYSIGGFDADRVVGNLKLGVGTAGEKFDAIGRGLLNIEGLPVYRDAVGGIGTPTSDEERTKISIETNKLLMIINGYSGEEGLAEAVAYSQELLSKYADARNVEILS